MQHKSVFRSHWKFTCVIGLSPLIDWMPDTSHTSTFVGVACLRCHWQGVKRYTHVQHEVTLQRLKCLHKHCHVYKMLSHSLFDTAVLLWDMQRISTNKTSSSHEMTGLGSCLKGMSSLTAIEYILLLSKSTTRARCIKTQSLHRHFS